MTVTGISEKSSKKLSSLEQQKGEGWLIVNAHTFFWPVINKPFKTTS